MAITIPDRSQIRITTKFEAPCYSHGLPNQILDTAMTNPGPLAAGTGGAVNSTVGQGQVTPAVGDAGDAGYIGYLPDVNQPVGAAVSACRNLIVDGFAGCTPGSPVFIDSTGADASPTASGLTHTQPTNTLTVTGGGGGTVAVPKRKAIGVALTATRIFFH